MRVVGWIASALGLVGVIACNGLAPLAWVLRADLRSRARDLLAVPEAGLAAASAVTGGAATWINDATADIEGIRRTAADLADTPAVDAAAAADLAGAIEAFITGPYATLRAVYGGLRERALAARDLLGGIGRAVPGLGITEVVAERLAAIDERLLAVDASVTVLAGLGPAGLAGPGVAATVAERAAAAGRQVEAIGEVVAEVEAWLADGRDRVAAAERRTSLILTGGAVAASAIALLGAGLNVLLFQQGRRWSSGRPGKG